MTAGAETAPALELTVETLQPVVEAPEAVDEAALEVAEELVEVAHVEVAHQEQHEMPGEMITVPGVEVETETPKIEIVLASAVPDAEMAYEMGSATKEAEWTEEPTEAEEVNHIEELIEFIEEITEEPTVEAAELAPVEEAVVVVAEEPAPVEALEEIEEDAFGAEAEEAVEVVMADLEQAEEPAQESIVIETVELEVEPVEDTVVWEAPESIEEIEIEYIEEIEVEDVEVAEIDETAKELNGMFAEMESASADEIEDAHVEDVDVELITEEAVKAFGEMFSEMAETIKAEMTELELVSYDVSEDVVEVSEEVSPEQTLVTLEFRDADLSAVLDILARRGNLNIIAGKGVSGKVTVRLIEVPLDVALNAILNVNGYGYLKTDSIIRILPLSEIDAAVNMITKTYDLSYATAADAKNTLTPFLSPNGSIEVDSRINMLVVTDIPANTDRLEKLITEIDRRVQQVLIEVMIVDSVLTDDADLGITWGLLDTGDNSPHGLGGQDNIGINLPTVGDALTLTFGTLIGDIALDIFVNALVESSDSKVLANPKILVLDNKSANIEIITEFPYSDTTQTSSGGQLSNITFKEIGTKLEVRPQITNDDHVILMVAPEQSSTTGQAVNGVPITETRKAETTLIMRNHQTIVMGGLRENRTGKDVDKVPLFGDLPILKHAFRNVVSTKTDSELLVFITVHIMDSPVLLPQEKIKAEELANLPRQPNSTIELIR
jgi:type IV pilus secretin PilQ/predicted competence protein